MKLPLPSKNGLRPNSADPLYRDGAGRQVLEHVQTTQFVQDFGSPRDSWVSQSPASARFTKGKPSKEPEKTEAQQGIAIQLGIKRQ